MSVFDQASLDAKVHQALVEAKVPADADGAFVVVATTSGGVRGVLATKINNVWEVDSVLGWKKGEGVDGGFAVKATWRN
jgi:hypothetical protein